jgi:hypothetical protein
MAKTKDPMLARARRITARATGPLEPGVVSAGARARARRYFVRHPKELEFIQKAMTSSPKVGEVIARRLGFDPRVTIPVNKGQGLLDLFTGRIQGVGIQGATAPFDEKIVSEKRLERVRKLFRAPEAPPPGYEPYIFRDPENPNRWIDLRTVRARKKQQPRPARLEPELPAIGPEPTAEPRRRRPAVELGGLPDLYRPRRGRLGL